MGNVYHEDVHKYLPNYADYVPQIYEKTYFLISY